MMLNQFPYYAVPKYSIPINQKKDPIDHLVFTEKHLRKLLRKAPFVQVLGGHHTRSYIDYSKTTRRPVFKFTFLRDPVSRYLSHFNYQRNVMGIEWDWREFLEAKKFNNWQTRRIASGEDLEKAKELVLKSFNFVGLTEKFDESLLLFRKSLESENFNPGYRKVNTTLDQNPEKPALTVDSLDEKEMGKVLDNNSLDSALYEFVEEEVFNPALETIRDGLDNQLSELKDLCDHFDLNRSSLNKNKLFRRYLNTFSSSRSSTYRF